MISPFCCLYGKMSADISINVLTHKLVSFPSQPSRFANFSYQIKADQVVVMTLLNNAPVKQQLNRRCKATNGIYWKAIVSAVI